MEKIYYEIVEKAIFFQQTLGSIRNVRYAMIADHIPANLFIIHWQITPSPWQTARIFTQRLL